MRPYKSELLFKIKHKLNKHLEDEGNITGFQLGNINSHLVLKIIVGFS